MSSMFRLIGSISLFALDYEPAGWARCDGRVLYGGENEQLFSLLGATFGGDPEQFTFGLPNLTGIAPKECHYCISLFGSYPTAKYEGLLGETTIWPIATPTPPNLVECNGQMLPKNSNMYLEMLVDARFGAADAGKFKLPDLRNRYPANCRYMMNREGTDPVGNSQRDPFVGEIMLLPYVPHEVSQDRWRLCDGGTFSVGENRALAVLLGNRFGGEGRIPDLRAAAPTNCNYYISLKGAFPPRA